MWDLIVSVLDHCLSFYFAQVPSFIIIIFFLNLEMTLIFSYLNLNEHKILQQNASINVKSSIEASPEKCIRDHS